MPDATARSPMPRSRASTRPWQATRRPSKPDSARSRMRYEAGYSPFLEVRDAQRTANTSELAALRNRQSLLTATVDLMKALGGGWSAEQLSLKQDSGR